MRRKTVLNNMKASFKISSDDAQNLLLKCAIDPKRRAETLSAQEFARLAEEMF